MEAAPANCPAESLAQEYLREAEALVDRKFDAEKAQAFTSKWIERQLKEPRVPEKFEAEELEAVCAMTAGALHRALGAKTLGYSEAVKKLHLLKAAGQNAHRALTWSFFAKPLARAEQFDQRAAGLSPGEVSREFPLAGFVMSIKDSIYVKGSPSTAGMFANLDRVPARDPQVVQTLRAKGAVITSKGNVPQLLFSPECGNNIFGEARHPLDETRTPGGSSGGEAALIALGFNNASLGTDIGGSVRIPALFCGISALKPTSTRVSARAQGKHFDRRYGSDRRPPKMTCWEDTQLVIPTCLGPLAKSAEDLETLMRVLVADQSFDRNVAPLPWREDVKFYKKVGVFKGHPLVELGPTAKRALDEAIQALLEAKYEVIEFDIEDLFAEAVAVALLAYNKNKSLQSVMYGSTKIHEPLFPLYELPRRLYSAPQLLLKFLARREEQPRRKMLIDAFLDAKKVSQQALLRRRDQLYYRLVERMQEHGVSAVLAPGVPTPAFKLKLSNKCLLANCYTFAWNLLDVPVGVTRVCHVREDEQFYESRHDDEVSAVLRENAQGSKGLPMGVSVVGKVFEEEVVLKVLRDIEENLGKIL